MVDTDVLAAKVASHLDGFTLNTDRDHWGSVLTATDGRELLLSRPWNHPDRVEVAGLYPNTDRPHDRAAITVAERRGPETIAAEIHRRLLPDYNRQWREVMDHNRQRQDQHNRCVRAAEGIAAKIPGATAVTETRAYRYTPDTRVRWNTSPRDGAIGYGHITLTYDGAEAAVDVRSIPVELAEELAEVIGLWAEWKTQETAR